MAGSNVPIDVPLTSISVANFATAKGFVADKVFPVVPVEVQTGLYYKLKDDDLNRDTAQRRADAAESAGDSFELANDNYRCEVFALHRDVGDQLQANYRDVPGTPFNSAAKFIVNKMRLREELAFADAYLKAGVWGTDLTGIASGTPGAGEFIQFDNDAVNPVETVEAWKDVIYDATGIEPNTLTLGKRAYSVLRMHPDIREQFKYTTAENITLEMLANVLEVERLLVSRGMHNTAKKGKGVSNTRIFDKGALLTYAPDAPGIEVPSAGYTFHWTGVSEGLGETIGTKQYRLEHLGADRVESQIAFDHKVVGANLGLFTANAVA